MNIVLQLSVLRLSMALSPPGREGYCLMWSILGCAAGQDMVLVSVPKHGKLFYAHLSQPGIVSKIDIPFRFFCPKQGQGVKPAASPLHPNIAQKALSSPPTPGSRRAQE